MNLSGRIQIKISESISIQINIE
ncbi:hypothetical protein ENT_07700 [Enterococcus faecalis]|nr:hypothetical protein ENT_07700 [Enterococcus faecalis]